MPTLVLRQPQIPRRGEPDNPMWPQSRIEEIYAMVQGASQWLGFHHTATIRDMLKANNERGNCWAAMLDDEIVGFTYVGSRRLYTHLMRNADIFTSEKNRRLRIATALYFAVFCQAVLEGRRQLEDTIIYDLSPFMADGFLPSLGYKRIGILPARTSGFRDIHLFSLDITVESLNLFTARLPGFLGMVELTDSVGTRDRFAKQMDVYEAHDPTVVAALTEIRRRITEAPSLLKIREVADAHTQE